MLHMYLAICFCHEASELSPSKNGFFIFFLLFFREAVTLFSPVSFLRLKTYFTVVNF
jgi:hypothetical protein